MKKIAVSVALACLLNTAHADDPFWIAVSAGKNGTTMYFDSISLKPHPNGTVLVWLKTSSPNGSSSAYSISHALLDCADQDQITISSETYFSVDTVVLNTNNTTAKTDVYPGSVLSGTVDIICKVVKKKAKVSRCESEMDCGTFEHQKSM